MIYYIGSYPKEISLKVKILNRSDEDPSPRHIIYLWLSFLVMAGSKFSSSSHFYQYNYIRNSENKYEF